MKAFLLKKLQLLELTDQELEELRFYTLAAWVVALLYFTGTIKL